MEQDESDKNKRLCIIITSVLCVVFGLIIIVGIGLYLRENYMIISRYDYNNGDYNQPQRRDNYSNYRGSYPRDNGGDNASYGC